MASIIRIKRSGVSGNPNTLGAGELAYSALADNGSNGGDRLYIGFGTETAGNAANHIVIGGKYFTDMLDHTHGVLTADSALITDSNNKIDVLNVDNLTLNGNDLTSTNTNGDINITPAGSGKTIISNLYIGDSSTSITEYIQDSVNLTLQEGEGIDLTYDDTAGTYTVAAEVATTSNRGVASFDSTDFTVTSGNVVLNDERIEDIIGLALTTNGTHSGISVSYDDAGDGIDLSLTNTGVTAGSYGSQTAIPTFTVDAQGRLTAASTVSVATQLSIAGDTGTDTVDLLNDTLTIAGGEGIDVAVTNNQITVSGEDASTTNKGVASFDSGDFAVTGGVVTIKTAGIGNTQLENNTVTVGSTTVSLGGTTTVLAGLLQLDVDNLRLDGNELSATSGGVSINPQSGSHVSVNNANIQDVADPINDTDAANKRYVDDVAQGISAKPAVRAATTANLTATYSNGTLGVGATLNLGPSATLVIDGVSLTAQFDGVLVKDQTNAYENGRYYVSQVGDASTDWILTRCGYCDEASEIPSAYVFVQEGTTYGGTGWVALVDDPGAFDVGTDDITWQQFSGAGTYTAGAGLTLTGTEFDINLATNSGLAISSDELQVASTIAGAGTTFSNGVIDIVGTANRITVNADDIDIASTYVGQTSITTLGTITTGTWNATVIDETYGGTGVNSYNTGDLLYASASNTLTTLAASTEGKVLQINASGVPIWGDVDGGTY